MRKDSYLAAMALATGSGEKMSVRSPKSPVMGLSGPTEIGFSQMQTIGKKSNFVEFFNAVNAPRISILRSKLHLSNGFGRPINEIVKGHSRFCYS